VSAVVQALAYAKAMGADVVNMSLGGPAWSNLMREAIRTGGFLAVVAAGNDSLDNDMWLSRDGDGDGTPDSFSPAYPASYTLPNILTVAASNHRDEYGYETGCFLRSTPKSECAFSNWGHDSVDLAAPGVDVTSTVPGGAYATWNGTSMAAPHVAGAAGLVKSEHPDYTPLQVKNAVMNAVDGPSSLKVLYTTLDRFSKSGSFTRTSGRVNAFSALTAATSNATPPTDGNIDGAKAMTTTSVSRAIRWPDDVNDVYRRTFYKGRKYRLVLDGPLGKDFDLFVWRPATKEIWQTCPTSWRCRLVGRSARAGTADEAVTFTAGATGVYYFHVGAWLFSGGSYRLTIRRL
jgi:subtilisin family serine protease